MARPSALPERLSGTVSIVAKFVSTTDPSVANPVRNINRSITIYERLQTLLYMCTCRLIAKHTLAGQFHLYKETEDHVDFRQ